METKVRNRLLNRAKTILSKMDEWLHLCEKYGVEEAQGTRNYHQNLWTWIVNTENERMADKETP